VEFAETVDDAVYSRAFGVGTTVGSKRGEEMNGDEFNDVVVRRCERIKTILTRKAAEYASETDRLHNFKAAGKLLDTTPEQALLGFLMKHLVSIFDMVHDLPVQQKPLALWDEKIGDAINYLILLEGLAVERDMARNVDSHGG
jgi:hypothetical protein